MVVLDGNFAVCCGPACNGLLLTTYISVYAITNEFLEPVMFVLAHPTVYVVCFISCSRSWSVVLIVISAACVLCTPAGELA